MTITSTQSREPASVVNVAHGRYITDGTAAAFVITTGFIPRYVRVTNVTSGDQYEWFEGMADASAYKITAATSARSLITTLGVTVDSRGFTVGLDLDVNVISEQLNWMAIG